MKAKRKKTCRKSTPEAVEITRTYDVEALNVQEQGRFRSDIGILRAKAQRLDYLQRCSLQELNLEELKAVAADVEVLARDIQARIELAKKAS